LEIDGKINEPITLRLAYLIAAAHTNEMLRNNHRSIYK